jgi:hypothetical protein
MMNFKNHQEENYIKNSLPGLERINKKPVGTAKSNLLMMIQQKKKIDVPKLSEEDL